MEERGGIFEEKNVSQMDSECAPGSTRGEAPQGNRPRKSFKRKLIAGIICGAILTVAFIVGATILIIDMTFDAILESDQYTVAYNYVIKTNAFYASGADKDDLRLVSYSSSNKVTKEGRRKTVEIEISGNDRYFTVFLHQDANGDWYVCKECTALR